MATLAAWVPDRQDIIWIDFSPQVGQAMKDLHPMLVLSPKAFNERDHVGEPGHRDFDGFGTSHQFCDRGFGQPLRVRRCLRHIGDVAIEPQRQLG